MRPISRPAAAGTRDGMPGCRGPPRDGWLRGMTCITASEERGSRGRDAAWTSTEADV
jgi:hypothetical protein